MSTSQKWKEKQEKRLYTRKRWKGSKKKNALAANPNVYNRQTTTINDYQTTCGNNSMKKGRKKHTSPSYVFCAKHDFNIFSSSYETKSIYLYFINIYICCHLQSGSNFFLFISLICDKAVLKSFFVEKKNISYLSYLTI